MPVTQLQAEVTKTSAFNGAALNISALAAPFEVAVVVDSLTPTGSTAIFQLQTSTDSFSADKRVEEVYAFEGVISNIIPLGQSFRDQDLPGFRAGTVSAEARLILAYLDAGVLTLSAPGTVTPTPSASGGTLAAATYFYKVTAIGNGGETLPSPEATSGLTTGSSSSVALAWAAVTGATSYRIYRGTVTNTENHYQTSGTNSFTDTGSVGTVGTPPTVNSTGTPSVSYSAHIKT